jgi:hypothetical protein
MACRETAMGTFEFLARPLWVNLLLLVPFVAYPLFRRGRLQLTARELFAAAIFALSFAFVEATVAIYLGAAVGLVQRDAGTFSNIEQLFGTLSAHAGCLGDLMPNLFAVERFREASTILILVSVAILAEPKRTERFAVFLWIFAIWDIGYYAALWMTVRWPASLTNPDVLFFIPVPWTAQVWFPILVSILTVAVVLRTRH